MNSPSDNQPYKGQIAVIGTGHTGMDYTQLVMSCKKVRHFVPILHEGERGIFMVDLIERLSPVALARPLARMAPDVVFIYDKAGFDPFIKRGEVLRDKILAAPKTQPIDDIIHHFTQPRPVFNELLITHQVNAIKYPHKNKNKRRNNIKRKHR